MNVTPVTTGELILLGSEGTEASFLPVWRQLLERRATAVDILSLQSHAPSLVYLSRLDLVEAQLATLGLKVRRRVDGDGRADGSRSVTLISAEKTLATDASDQNDHEAQVRLYLDLVRAGGVLIAGAAAAAALGEAALELSRPLPPHPDDALLVAVRGLGMITVAAILPYYDQIATTVRAKIRNAFQGIPLLIGIDQNAALIINETGAHAAGLGKVTLLRDNETVWAGAAGQALPPGLISLNVT